MPGLERVRSRAIEPPPPERHDAVEAMEDLVDALRSYAAAKVCTALERVGEVGDSRVIPDVIQIIRDDSEIDEVKMAACKTLLTIAERTPRNSGLLSAIPQLLECLEEADFPELRAILCMIFYTIARHNPQNRALKPAVLLLARFLYQKDSRLVGYAIDTLGYIGDNEAHAILAEFRAKTKNGFRERVALRIHTN